MSKIEVIFYELPNGEEPARKFIQGLDVKMRAKMLRTIAMLQTNGWELREPASKAVGNGIFELRAKVGNNITRVLYFFFTENKAVLTNGFIKKSKKTPSDEIERAMRYREDFLIRRRMENDEI